MTASQTGNGVRAQIDEHARRLDKIERRVDEAKPEVIVEKIGRLEDRMSAVNRLMFWMLTAFLGAAIAFSVWALELAQRK